MNSDAAIEISVVIPTFNRHLELSRALEALAGGTFAKDKFEVIIVDDGGAKSILTVVGPFKSRLNVTLLRQFNQGAAAARNLGATQARGRFIVFTDDDCAPDAHWLESLVRALTQHPESAVGGRTINALDRNSYAAGSQLLIDYMYAYEAVDENQVGFLAGNHIACALKNFEALGGFDSSFSLSAAEDRDFCRRWKASGKSIRQLPDAVLYHAHDLCLKSFCKQHFNYGRGALNFRLREAQSRATHLRLAPMRFYFDLIRYPFLAECNDALKLSLLLVLSQFANAAGFFYQFGRHTLERSEHRRTVPSLTAAPPEY